MRYFVYILRCIDGSLYTGITWNLKKRVGEHNLGLSNYTKPKIPVKLIYFEDCNDKISAAKREKEIKGWSRQKKLNLANSSRLSLR